MNALVIYDSLYGDTERIAQAIAGALREYGQVRAVRAVRVDPAHPVELQGWTCSFWALPLRDLDQPRPCSPSSETSHPNR